MIKRIFGINSIKINFCFSAFICVLFLHTTSLFAQDLPNEIRGYKVRSAKISVINQAEKLIAANKSEAVVKIGEPKLVDVSLSGIEFEMSAEIESVEQSGTIDFLAFRNFRVNDLQVDVAEYKQSFEIKRGETVRLPKPIKITVGVKETLRGALKELKESKKEWTVTGTIFVFGHFKKSFLRFKRVVPVAINLKIKNPLAAMS